MSKTEMETRMHSRGMRTAGLLTISQHALGRGFFPSMHWAGGACLGEVCLRVSAWGVSAQGVVCPGSVCPEGCVSARGFGVWQTHSPRPEADTPLWTE